MKKFYGLIESESTRKYCEETGYVPDALQCIKLVYDSETLSLEEKHNLYKEIMKIMPEPELTEEQKAKYDKTVYEMLKENIELEKQAAEAFLKDADEPVYKYDWHKSKMPLKSILADEIMCLIYNTKLEDSCAWFLADGAINYISVDSDFADFFYNCTIPNFPGPFKRGDIVCYNYYGYNRPCVVDSVDTDAIIYEFEFSLQNGIGHIANKAAVPCNDLTYFTDELKPNDKFLKVLSDYLCGKINVATLLNAYVVHLNRREANELNSSICIEKDYLSNIFGEDAKS